MSIKAISHATALVIDSGIFLPVARKLGESFGRVLYWSPDNPASPHFRDVVIGMGFPEIERETHPLDVKGQIDCCIFPDVDFRPYQQDMLAAGIPTWGGGRSEQLETNRGLFLKELEACGLPVPPHEIVPGDKLRDYLEDKEDLWVKVDRWRGDWETFHWRNWAMDHVELEVRLMRFGPMVKLIPFYVFEPIETDLEDGADTHFVGGKWPTIVNHGMEKKNLAYLMTFCAFKDLPDPVREVHEKFGPVLERYGHRGPVSSEARIVMDGDKAIPYFIDLTSRNGSPPHQLQTEMIENYAEVAYRGAQGECIDPVPAYQFGVQALVTAHGPSDEWSTVVIPKELDQWLKCGFCCFEDDALHFPPLPDQHGDDIGWLLGVGDTIEEALDNAREHQAMLPDGLECDFSALADLLKEAHEAEDEGLPFTDDDIPDPASVLGG
jgi:hypothetical protein